MNERPFPVYWRWMIAAASAGLVASSCTAAKESDTIEFTKCSDRFCLSGLTTAEIEVLSGLSRTPGVTVGEWYLYDPTDVLLKAVDLVKASRECDSADSVTVTVTTLEDVSPSEDGLILPVSIIGWSNGQSVCQGFSATSPTIPRRTLQASVEEALKGNDVRMVPMEGASISDDVH